MRYGVMQMDPEPIIGCQRGSDGVFRDQDGEFCYPTEPSDWSLPDFLTPPPMVSAVISKWPMILGLVAAAGLVAYAVTSKPSPRRRRRRA